MRNSFLLAFSFFILFGLTTSAHATILDVTNAQKLSLATSTPIGQVVRVSDGFMVSGATSDASSMKGLWVQSGTLNGKPKFIHTLHPSDLNYSCYWDTAEWIISNEIGFYYSTDGNIAFPWLVSAWGDNITGTLPDPGIVYPALQQLSAASTSITAVFISGAGTTETNGIYLPSGFTSNGKPVYSQVDNGGDPNSIRWTGTNWTIYNGGTNFYTSTENVAYPWLVNVWDVTDGEPSAPAGTSITQGKLYAGVGVSGAATVNANDTYILMSSAQNGKYKYSGITNGFVLKWTGTTWNINNTNPTAITDSAFPWEAIFNNSATVTRSDVASENNWQTYTPDTTAPLISGVASSTTATSASISFLTDESASSTLNFGLTTGYGTASTSSALATSTAFTLTGLTASTLYHYRITVSDSSSNLATSSDLTFTTTAPPDTTPPSISSVSSTPSDTTALISWSTSESASSTVSYGLNASYGSVTATSTATSTTLSSLSACTLYHFRITSTDASSNSATSSDQTFSTTGCSSPSSTPTPTPGSYTGGSSGYSIIPPPNATPSPALTPCANGSLFNTQTGAACAFSPTGSAQIVGPFTSDLAAGSKSLEVTHLQQYLNSHGYAVAKSGAGSPGYETAFFGPATRAALIKFQKAVGIKPASGYFGPITRRYISLH